VYFSKVFNATGNKLSAIFELAANEHHFGVVEAEADKVSTLIR